MSDIDAVEFRDAFGRLRVGETYHLHFTGGSLEILSQEALTGLDSYNVKHADLRREFREPNINRTGDFLDCI